MDIQASEPNVTDTGTRDVNESNDNDETLAIQPRQAINRLGLTPQFNFYRRAGPKTIFSRVEIPWKPFGNDTDPDVTGGWVTWALDLYAYAFGAPLYIRDANGKSVRNRNFAKEGGQMLWILVHSGHFEVEFCRGTNVEYIASIEGPLGAVSDQFPRSNSWQKEGDTYKYSIDYGNRLDMYKNAASQIENVDISYQETYPYLHVKQNVERLDSRSNGFSLKADDLLARGTQLQFHGLTVFRTTDVVDMRWFWPKFGLRGRFDDGKKVVERFTREGSISMLFDDLNNLPY